MIRQKLKIPKACQFYFNTGMRRLRVLYYLKMANKNVSNYQKWSKSLVSPYKSVHEFNLLQKGINRKSDKFSLISDNYGQCNCILSFPLAQNKVLGGEGGDFIGRSENVTQGCWGLWPSWKAENITLHFLRGKRKNLKSAIQWTRL